MRRILGVFLVTLQLFKIHFLYRQFFLMQYSFLV